MPTHAGISFANMQRAAEAITAQISTELGDFDNDVNTPDTEELAHKPNISLAYFRYTLLLIFEEVSRNMPREAAYDGMWTPTERLTQAELAAYSPGPTHTKSVGPIIPGGLAVTAGADFSLDNLDLFHGTFNEADLPVGDFDITVTRITNAIVLPPREQSMLLNVHEVKLYRNGSLFLFPSTGLNTNRIDEWDNQLFLYTDTTVDGNRTVIPFDLQDGDAYRIFYEVEWDPTRDDDDIPDGWPIGFPDRVKENVLQGYIAHILLQQAADAQHQALQALIDNETSFTGPSHGSLNGALEFLDTVLATEPAVGVFNLPAFNLAAVNPSIAIVVHTPDAVPFTLDADGNLDTPEAPTFAPDPLYAITAEPDNLQDFPVVADPPDLTAIYTALEEARDSIVALADLADLPDNAALEAYIETGNDSVWSRLTAIRAELEGDTSLDPRNPDAIDKTAWERLDQALQDALSSLRSGYLNSAGVETGLIRYGASIISPSAAATTSPKGYLVDGDNFINNVNIGRDVPDLYTQYSRASLDIGRATVEAAAAQNQQAIGLTNLAAAYAQKIEQYLSYARVVLSEWENLSAYIQARASAVVQNNQAIVAGGQGQVQISLAKINAVVEEIRARTAIAELDVRIGQLALEDRRSAREVHGRVQESKGFLQGQTWQVQGQAYGNLLQALAGAYRSRIEVAGSTYSAGVQALSANFSTEAGVEIQGYGSKASADIQAYTTQTQASTQTFTTKLQAAGQRLENVVEAMLRRNEISNQYREIADRYQQEGQSRHDIYIRNLREKADAIGRRSK